MRAEAPRGLTVVDAVKQALIANPTIQLERTARQSSIGSSYVAAGRFDWIVDATVGHQVLHTPYTAEIQRVDNITQLTLGVTKQLPWGMTVHPTISLQRTSNVIPSVLSSSTAPQNLATISVRIAQPLLRNFGSATSAERDAALIFARASGQSVQHVIATRVFTAAAAYWQYVSALKSVEVLRTSEGRAEQILREAQALVRADERPKADLEQLEASLADRVRARIEAEESSYEARSNLGLEMGLTHEAIAQLAPPVTPLPDAAVSTAALTTDQLIAVALGRRQDLAGADARTAAYRTLLSAAENRLRPQLDLVGDLGYSGVVGGSGVNDFFLPLAKNIPGPNGQIALSFQWPVANSAAYGELQHSQAALRRSEIDREDIVRRIGAGVGVALELLSSSTRALERAKKAAVHYRAAVTNERTKLKGGLSTIIDVILTEDLMTRAELNELGSQTRYATSLARLAYESGTLTVPDGEDATIDTVRLLSAPKSIP